MTLIKLGDGLTDVSGKLGGVVFGRDASGLHARASTLAIQRTPTGPLQKQRSWYAGIKKEEHHAGPPPLPIEIPKTPTCFAVFSANQQYGIRTRSLTHPTETPVQLSGFYLTEIQQWIEHNQTQIWITLGISKELAEVMMLKWFLVYKDTLGFSSDVALLAAKTNMADFVSANLAAGIYPIIGLWLSLLLFTIYLKVDEATENGPYFYTPPKGSVFLWGQNGLSMGGLIARATPKMYEFALCGQMPSPAFTIKQMGINHDKYEHIVRFSELYQTWHYYIPLYFTYTWQACWITFLGYGYSTNAGTILVKANEWTESFIGVPVGFGQTQPAACNYTSFLF